VVFLEDLSRWHSTQKREDVPLGAAAEGVGGGLLLHNGICACCGAHGQFFVVGLRTKETKGENEMYRKVSGKRM